LNKYQQELVHLITEPNADFDSEILKLLQRLDSRDTAQIFVDVSFLITGLNFVNEQYWLKHNGRDEEDDKIIFLNFIKKFLKVELYPLLFFHSTLENATIEAIKVYQKNAVVVQKAIVNYVKLQPNPKEFATAVLKLMSELYEFEYQLAMKKIEQNLTLGYSLYRTFDILDSFFGLDYKAEAATANEPATAEAGSERVSAGSGVGVQSSYATLLLALRYLRIPSGTRFIDLGSGFGRVGLVVGLLRPDIVFTGFELVQQRVDMASAASEWLGMKAHVSFIAQDLSATDFAIPEAETYYIYDPFNESTYTHVLAQLNVIAAKRKINVITKGNAKNYFQGAFQRNIWSRPQEFDSGNFCLFRSH
jgi:hypothetical protein